MARQLYDIQQGTRNGASTLSMKPVVANLTGRHVADHRLRGVARTPGVSPSGYPAAGNPPAGH
jgi:hypothetical protein